MNGRAVAVLAVGIAFGLVAVSGAVAFSPAGGNALPGVAPSPNGTDTGTRIAGADDGFELAAASGQVVRGKSDLDAGSTVQVRLQSVNGSASPFLQTVETEVAENGSFRAIVDLSGTDPGTRFVASVYHDGDRLTNATGAVVALEGGAPDTGEGDADDASASDDDTSLVYDGDRLTLQSAPEQTISGETTLATGTELTVRLRSTDSASPFLKSVPATVSGDGTFRAQVDVSGIEPGTTFEVAVRHDGETLAEASGEVTDAN